MSRAGLKSVGVGVSIALAVAGGAASVGQWVWGAARSTVTSADVSASVGAERGRAEAAEAIIFARLEILQGKVDQIPEIRGDVRVVRTILEERARLEEARRRQPPGPAQVAPPGRPETNEDDDLARDVRGLRDLIRRLDRELEPRPAEKAETAERRPAP